MRGFWFYAFLGLITSTLFVRGMPSGPVAWIAVCAVNGIAVLFWLAMARDIRREAGAVRSVVATFVLASPFSYAAGLLGGLWLFAR
jgi:hypothetical protein